MIDVLNLGAGVQSTTLYYMSALGELPKFHTAIFADTGTETTATMEHLERLKEWGAANGGSPIVTVRGGNMAEELRMSKERRYASVPFFVLNPDGTKGKGRRQCTAEYKIRPILKYIRNEILDAKGKRLTKPLVRQWFGISVDENRRCVAPRSAWLVHSYPLCDWEIDFDGTVRNTGRRIFSRAGCIAWLESNNLPVPPRSACIVCPFRNGREMANLKASVDWAAAVELDRVIRNARKMNGEQYVHRDLVPLDVARIDPADDYPLFQCEDGVCGT